MNANAMNLGGRSFTELLAMIRIGHIDTPVTVLTVDLADDLIVVNHGDVAVVVHKSHTSISYDDYTSAGEMADVIAKDMANWGTGYAAVWFAGEHVHYSSRGPTVLRLARKGGTGENN